MVVFLGSFVTLTEGPFALLTERPFTSFTEGPFALLTERPFASLTEGSMSLSARRAVSQRSGPLASATRFYSNCRFMRVRSSAR